MANTVNDVMNVIASPDYGIKNIAGTNQEILAILEGTHNSDNNIHAIVNDVRNILQKIVNVTKSNIIEVKTNNSTRINKKHIQDILDETKGIRKSIDNLARKIEKNVKSTPAVAKLSDKASQKVADAMVKTMEKQNKGGAFSAVVDAFNKLKNISIKDILLGKRKIKSIMKIFQNAKKELNIEEEELNAIIKLVNASPEVIKTLNKVNWKINRIIKNNTIGKLKDILVGKNSLLSLSKTLKKNEKVFEEASKIANNIKDLAGALKTAMKKMFFAALWAKFANKGIDNITTFVNKIYLLSKTLIKNKDNIRESAKVAKNMTTLVGNLLITSIYLTIGAITAGPAIIGMKLLTTMTNNILPICKNIAKNKNDIDKSGNVAKNITFLVGNLLITSIFLTIGAVTAAPAILGAILISKVVDRIVPIANILSKNKNNINKGARAALGLTVLVGNLLITSIFLTISVVTFIPAILGAILMSTLIDVIIPINRKLSRNSRNIGMAILSALGLVTVTGLISITSYILADIGKKTGLSAILGSVLVLGIVYLNVIAFKMLGRAIGTIIKGAISMSVMSLSLLLFSVALEKISNATKNVSFKQIGVIATLTAVLGGAVALLGIPVVFPFILLGSISMAIMGFALRPFVNTLSIIGKTAEKLKYKDILLITGSMGTIALAISGLALLLIPVSTGALTLAAINNPLKTFVKTIKIIKEMGTIPTKEIKQVLSSMKEIGNFFSKNSLNLKAVRNARRYKRIMKPFTKAVFTLSKLSEMKEIPLSLVNQSLNAMRSISEYYINNPISRETIKQARKYKRMMRPFGNTVGYLAKLKKIGDIPMSLVNQTLEIMSAIANYYTTNPITKKSIKQARKYKRMLRPFGNTVGYLAKLKEVGEIPMELVNQTLSVMTAIANYYASNPIKRKSIKQARRYKRMLKPFGKTVDSLSKLSQMGEIPIGLVYRTLEIMSAIALYYENNPISSDSIYYASIYKRIIAPFSNTVEHLSEVKKKLGVFPTKLLYRNLDALYEIAYFYQRPIIRYFDDDAITRASVITTISSSFSETVNALKTIKGLDNVSTDAVSQIVTSLSDIAWFYKYVSFGNNIEYKSELTKLAVTSFTDVTTNIQKKLTNIKGVDDKAIVSIIRTCYYIIGYYQNTKFKLKKQKVLNMNECIELFLEKVDNIQKTTKNFSRNNYMNVGLVLESMKQIMSFLKTYSLNAFQRKRAKKNITLLSLMSSAMANISNMNPTNISSMGDALTNALGGVNSVEITQVKAVTDMFNAFNNINKSENIIHKFTESVNEFTATCKNLIDAMGSNTDAINGVEFGDYNDSHTYGSSQSNTVDAGSGKTSNISKREKGVRIVNVDEIAKTIAEKINGALSVDMPDAQVQLLINGSGGNEWTITKC